MNIIINPAIIFVLIVFVIFITIFIGKAIEINKSINRLIATLKTFNKNDLIYRFQELDKALDNDNFVADYWREFKKTLIFSDSIIYKSQNDELHFESAMENQSRIYCTIDVNMYFNEETLINRKINHKLISSIPGLLTGLGPLGTFLYIAVGFSTIDFSTEENTINSITKLLSNLEIAAVISILAIGSALCFIMIERITYHFLCKLPLSKLQLEINRLFDKITPEKFLFELIKESKKQNNIINNHITNLPQNIKGAFDSSIKSNLTPYLENLVFGLNQQQELFSKDVINKLLEQ